MFFRITLTGHYWVSTALSATSNVFTLIYDMRDEMEEVCAVLNISKLSKSQ